MTILILVVWGRLVSAWGQSAGLNDIELYTPLTIPVTVDSTLYSNPFDPDDIEVLGIFHSPSGKESVIPGFWMQPYADLCAAPCQTENLQPKGDPLWQIRFTPQEVGAWTYTLQVRNDNTTVSTQSGQINVVPSNRPGFIRVSPNHRYFQYQNGQSYFPIGHNLSWSWDGVGGVDAYLQWLQQLSAAGGNYARLMIDDPWFIGLESGAPIGDYRGAQKAAARLDMILDAAANDHIALQLVLLWHQALTVYNGAPVTIPATPPRPDTSADWDNNPYNIVNGGPLNTPASFFIDDQARRLFRRRLQYIVARWGFSPQVFAWEIVDQIDRTADYAPATANAWLSDVASTVKQIDSEGHLITAGSLAFDPVIAANPLLDFTEGQFYQRRPVETASDQGAGTLDVVRQNLQANPVPALLTDYSLNPWFEPTADDPNGIHFQTTLWTAALSGAGGAAASDWGDTYVIPQGLQRYYAPLADFVSGVNWAALNLQPAEAGFLIPDTQTIGYAPLHITGFNPQFRASADTPPDVSITADGTTPHMDSVPSFLYGTIYNNQYHQPQTYHVTLPVATSLEVRVKAVSSDFSARLSVSLDGQNLTEVGLQAGSKDVSVRVTLPPGEHTLVLDNTGDDWLQLDWLEIAQLIAPVRVLTLRDSSAGVALAWLQNRAYTWENAAATRQPINGQFRLDNMPPGRYRAEFWDPLSGAVLGEDILNVGADHALALDLLPIDRMLAVRITRFADTSPVAATPTTMISSTLQPTQVPSVIATTTPSSSLVPSVTPLPTIPALTPSSTLSATQTPAVSPVPSITPSRTLIPLTADSPTPFILVTNTPRPSPTP